MNRTKAVVTNAEKNSPKCHLYDMQREGTSAPLLSPMTEFSAGQFLTLKFHNCGAYAELLSHEMVRSIKDVYRDREFDLVTCVPMHKDTLRERGYNQAELLAKECARLLGIEYADLLAKTKKNKTQHSIKAAERAKNVIGVYSPIDKNLIKGKRILIIDDIITTGSTLGECARILSKCKCGEICCCTLCTSLLI